MSLEAANQQLAAAEDRLRAVQNKIATLEEALVKLKAEYTRATDAKLRCQVIRRSFVRFYQRDAMLARVL